MKTAIKISKNSISVKDSNIDLRDYEEEIADFLAGLRAEIILSSDKFIPWEKAKHRIDKKIKAKK